jgi:hypothetical protein
VVGFIDLIEPFAATLAVFLAGRPVLAAQEVSDDRSRIIDNSTKFLKRTARTKNPYPPPSQPPQY